jgi:hypothetical protein
MAPGLSADQFDELFRHFADSPTSTAVWRWEGRQSYAIPSDEPSLVAFRDGTPRPGRSVRTSPWLARIATSTAAGKLWRRVRPVTEPLSEYVQWELLAYVESQAAGEEIRVLPVDGMTGPEDVWVFDGDTTNDRYAIVMHYDADGSPLRFELVTGEGRVRNYLTMVGGLFDDALPLNAYLAPQRLVSGAA